MTCRVPQLSKAEQVTLRRGADQHRVAGKPFFLYLPFSLGHVPNLPSQQFKGKSRIGNYGDKLMEGATTSAASSIR